MPDLSVTDRGGEGSVQVERPSIALCMLVRNEEAIIERCLRSVLPLIDAWVVCDTGSTDETQHLVRSMLGELPGELHEREWVDFGKNRTELMRLALGAADYLLLIDADMTVVQRAPLPRLDADAYLLRETGALDFAVTRLVRADRTWWYEGATHEFIATDGRFRQEQLDELLIEHHGDGTSRRGKLLRDVGLLKHDLEREPRNPRPVFYLAQTYRDLGRTDVAIEYYRRRVELGGWDEEVFYANLQEGILRSEPDFRSAVPVLLEAWQRRPTRAEPLYELARGYRRQGDYTLAELFAARGLEVPYPSDLLFVHRWVYEWGLRLEHALALAGLGRREEARTLLRELLRDADLPREIEGTVARRLAELAERDLTAWRADRAGLVQRLDVLAPSVRLGEIELESRPDWPCFNPSIATAGDGFAMIVRTANYEIERGVLHAEGVLHNINYLFTLDAELSVTAAEPIVDRTISLRRYPSQVQGYEDCRLVRVAGRWYASATVCDLNPVERREIALLELDGATIADVVPLAGPHPGRHEKNWMPFVRGDDLHFVYRCSPTIVLRYDAQTAVAEQISSRDGPEEAREFRGGSQGLPVSGGTLFVVHEVDHGESALRYVHRFVLLDDDLGLASISRPFTFINDHVEFCAGLARQNGELVLSFGVSDAAAGLAVIDEDEAFGLLEPVPASAAARLTV